MVIAVNKWQVPSFDLYNCLLVLHGQEPGLSVIFKPHKLFNRHRSTLCRPRNLAPTLLHSTAVVCYTAPRHCPLDAPKFMGSSIVTRRSHQARPRARSLQIFLCGPVDIEHLRLHANSRHRNSTYLAPIAVSPSRLCLTNKILYIG